MSRHMVGDKVLFGPTGEIKTLGILVGLRAHTVIIRLLERRGSAPIGTIWTVSDHLCRKPTERELALKKEPELMDQMGTTLDTLKKEKGKPRQYGKELFEPALKASRAILQASLQWTEEEETANPDLRRAYEAAAAFLTEAKKRGLY